MSDKDLRRRAPRSPHITRAMAVQRLKARLHLTSFPRLQMLLLVALTGGFGLLSSFVMLRCGLDSMALRYPLALACAYLFFLGLLWLWMRSNAKDYLDIPDLSGATSLDGSQGCGPDIVSGGGGDFGGGGATGSFDEPLSSSTDAFTEPVKSIGEKVGGVLDGDELVIPIAVVVLAVGIALASLYVVHIAPILFAELLVDGVLSYALFRHLRPQERPLWLASAMRHTLLPFALTGIFLALAGLAMSAYAPEARSLG